MSRLDAVVCLFKGHDFEIETESIRAREKAQARTRVINRECERCGLELGEEL